MSATLISSFQSLCKLSKCQHSLITTPIFYVNASPHIGHLYSAVLADAAHRWHVLKGAQPAVFSTGTDEHGLKIQKAALVQGCTPRELCDTVSSKFKALFDAASISYTDYIRTTEKRHTDLVTTIWSRLCDRGYIYKGKYEGWYSIPDETFLSASQIRDGDDGNKYSLESGHQLEWSSEENYLFRLSAFKERLLSWVQQEPCRWSDPPSDIGWSDPPSDIGWSDPPNDIGWSDPPSDIGWSDPPSDIGWSDPPSDIGWSDPPSDIGWSDPPSDIGWSDPPSDIGWSDPPSDIGWSDPPSDIGWSDPPSDIGWSDPPSDIGWSDPPSDIGWSDPPSDIGWSDPPSDIGWSDPPSDIGWSDPPSDIGWSDPPSDIGWSDPPSDIGWSDPPSDIGWSDPPSDIAIIPDSARHQVVKWLSSEALEDVSVSRPRSRLTWGIPVPNDGSHTSAGHPFKHLGFSRFVDLIEIVNELKINGYHLLKEEMLHKHRTHARHQNHHMSSTCSGMEQCCELLGFSHSLPGYVVCTL
eukprot:Em0005g1269a